jgi:hypothetical protein
MTLNKYITINNEPFLLGYSSFEFIAVQVRPLTSVPFKYQLTEAPVHLGSLWCDIKTMTTIIVRGQHPHEEAIEAASIKDIFITIKLRWFPSLS